MIDSNLEIVMTAKDITAKAFNSVERRCKSMFDNVTSLNGVVVSLAGAGGIGYLIKSNLELTAEMQKNATMAGVSLKSYQELDYVAGQYKITTESLTDGLKELNLRAEEFAVTGAGPGKEAFERLGYSQEELNEKLKDTPALLSEIIRKMEGMENAAKMRIADEIFGGTGGEQFVAMINGGADAIKDLTEKAHELGLVMKDETATSAVAANKAIDVLTKQLSAQFSTVVAELAPDIESVTKQMTAWVGQNRELIRQKTHESINSIGAGLKDIRGVYDAIPEDIRGSAGLGLVGAALFGAKGGAVLGGAHFLYKETKDFLEGLEGLKAGKISMDEFFGDEEVFEAALKRYREMKKSIATVTGEINKSTEGFEHYNKTLANTTGQNNNVTKSYEDLVKRVMPEHERLKLQERLAVRKQIDLQNELTKAMDDTYGDYGTWDDGLYDDQIKAGKDAADERLKIEKELKQDYEKLWNDLNETSPLVFADEDLSGIANAINAVDSLTGAYERQAQAVEVINAARKAGKDVTDIEARSQDRFIKESLSGYSNLFGTIGQFYDENSKGREAMHNLEMAFGLAEIALEMQKMIPKAVNAVLTQGQGDPYSAFARIAAMTAVVGGLVAIAGGSFGGSGGGSGAAPIKAENRTGSVLGYAGEASESLEKSQELLEDMHMEDYTELRGIHGQMKSLNRNITGLVSNLFRGGTEFTASGFGITEGWTPGGAESFASDILGLDWDLGLVGPLESIIGDAIGAFDILGPLNDWIGEFASSLIGDVIGGGMSSWVSDQGITADPFSLSGLQSGGKVDAKRYADVWYEEDGGWFGKDVGWASRGIVDLNASVDDMFTKIFVELGESLLKMGDIIGQDAAAIEEYIFEIGDIDLSNLETAGEINEAISAALSGISDDAAAELFGGLIGQYQAVGEGMLETAVRVASQKTIVQDILDTTNQSFQGRPADVIAFSQSLIDLSGDFDTLFDSFSTYSDKFFSDAEKQEKLKENLIERFSTTGWNLPRSRDAYRDIYEGLNLNTEAGKEMAVMLLNLAEASDEYYSALENKKEDLHKLRDWQLGLSELEIRRQKYTGPGDWGDFEDPAVQQGLIDWAMETRRSTIDNVLERAGVSIAEFMDDILYFEDLLTENTNDLADAEDALMNARKAGAQSIDDLIRQLEGGSLSPVQSMEYFQREYENAINEYSTATTPEEITAAINNIVSTTPEYAEYAQDYGGKFKDTFSDIVNNLRGISDSMSSGNGQEQNIEVRVYIGEEQIETSTVDVLRNSRAARQEVRNIGA